MNAPVGLVQPPQRRRPWWFWPLLGGALGLLYGVVDWVILDQQGRGTPELLKLGEELVDLILPVLAGLAGGFGVNLLLYQTRANAQLSLENSQLQRHILTSTLISQLLHDIRNPIHNLAAAIESGASQLPEEERQIVRRNLERLEHIVAQYSRWGALQDALDPTEPVALHPWLQTFVHEKLRPLLRSLNAQCVLQIDPVRICMHPILLEQVFTTLCANAYEAMAHTHGLQRLTIAAHQSTEDPTRILLRLANTGSPFPQDVLTEQGRKPVASRQGLGLGLVLVRKMLEQAGGDVRLSNEDCQAVVTILLPGQPE